MAARSRVTKKRACVVSVLGHFLSSNEPTAETGGRMARLALCAVMGFLWERERISDDEALR